ncbi:hypothetical protein NON00_23115 [Roseomonas sp. GC11]|uniref:LptM family lipoprotein n=1 Tax=Roseomonas sp. GC11 TaxID=2950546 RepID=UPI00210AB9B8|nr:hypothetical protein [Roseomonas sp. GC11]MCQ4162799.1 hypothetical protein [Roseomonas sp. GC11]
MDWYDAAWQGHLKMSCFFSAWGRDWLSLLSLGLVALALAGCGRTTDAAGPLMPPPSQESRCDFTSDVELHDGAFQAADEGFIAAAVRQMRALGSDSISINTRLMPPDDRTQARSFADRIKAHIEGLGVPPEQILVNIRNFVGRDRIVTLFVCTTEMYFVGKRRGPEFPDLRVPIRVAGQRFAIPLRYMRPGYWNNVPISDRRDTDTAALRVRWPGLGDMLPPKPPLCDTPGEDVEGCTYLIPVEIIPTSIPADAVDPWRYRPEPGYGAGEAYYGDARILCTWFEAPGEGRGGRAAAPLIRGPGSCSVHAPSIAPARIQIGIPGGLIDQRWEIARTVADFVMSFAAAPAAAGARP